MSKAPDVVVVGGGMAGICTWDLLRRSGCVVELIEAGPCDVATPSVTTREDPDWTYSVEGDRAGWSRVHALGGRAHVWGGWLGRFSDTVFSRGGWPVRPGEMARAYSEAEQWLGSVEHSLPESFAALQDCGGQITGRLGADGRVSPWSVALTEAPRFARGHTVVLRLLHQGGRVHGLEVSTAQGIEKLFADQIVLAASPVESCRLLLMSGASHAEVGRNFTDHVTTLCYVLARPDGTKASRTDARGALLRFSPGQYASFDRGFTVEVFGPKPLEASVARLLGDQGLMAYEGMPYTVVGAIGEQFPCAGRSVRLDQTRRDRVGRLAPLLSLTVAEDDVLLLEAMRAVCTEVGSKLDGAEMVEVRNSLEAPHVFHPGGVARMGASESAPVDEFGRFREWPNVWIADASVFPTSGDTYPTLTVIAHIHRLVHRLLTTAGPTTRPG